MIIRLLPNQVSKLWDAIKFAVARTDRIDNGSVPQHLKQIANRPTQ